MNMNNSWFKFIDNNVVIRNKQFKFNNKLVNKVRVMVCISGRGSNFKALIDSHIKEIQIVSCITNNQDAKGLYYALSSAIPICVLNKNDNKINDAQFIEYIKIHNPKIIVLAGFMSIISKRVLDFLNDNNIKIINIHPSLLPKYKGLNTHKRFLLSNDEYHGCTVHYVTNELDSGEIIEQSKILLNNKNNLDEDSLSNIILNLEHKLLSKVVRNIAVDILKEDVLL